MFQAIKGFRKADLKFVAEELGEIIPPECTIATLKEIILNSNEYKNDPNFVQEILSTAVVERQEKEKLKVEQEKDLQQQKLKLEQEEKIELEKLNQELEIKKMELDQQLELARIQSQAYIQGESILTVNENNSSRRKISLPKLQFRQFDGDLKEWLPFWSQFEQIDKDNDIPPENKFQYLIQATVAGSRAREVVDSFPPTGANYAKVIESLKARYGRDDLLVEVYVRELLKLIIVAHTKENFSLTSLYDKLESYLRALETLGVTTDKCASILYPMVESCFPAEFLKAWNRSNIVSTSSDAKERLDNLMQFLKCEVEGDERINLAVAGFGLAKKNDDRNYRKRRTYTDVVKPIPTASTLLTTSFKQDLKKNCVFCNGKHMSSDCFTARKMSFNEKQNVLKDKKCCFLCLGSGHTTKQCKAVLKCFICDRKHSTVMCQSLDKGKTNEREEKEKSNESEVNMANFNKNPRVFLQTLKAKVVSDNKEKDIRLILDTGSQRSYILKKLAEEMKYAAIKKEKVVHSLFGGVSTKEYEHSFYKIRLRDLTGKFRCNFEVLDQNIICENVKPVGKGSWLKELAEKDIVLTDVGDADESIQVLIGADIIGKLLTGRREVLSSGLVAMETLFGWTLMGKVPQESSSKENLALSVTSMFVKEAEISDLWRLDLLGISDPIEKLCKMEVDRQVKEHFLQTVTRNKDGRYEISLPWAEDKPPLPDNLCLAKKRLTNVTQKLLASNIYEKYEEVLLGWLGDKIIEEVPECERSFYGHYLPHRPVIKENSTTPIRPVFDASARIQNHPSLNQCLHCGPNLIELIPDILLRFRENKFGVLADIKKAFLQISIRKEDRDFLRFLWWSNPEQSELRIFRHARVVFGVKSSPFLLASVIEYHIKNDEEYDPELKQRLLRSFYVDNVVTSVRTEEELKRFITCSKNLMSKGGFDLRGWEHTEERKDTEHGKEAVVLGLHWNRFSDILKVNVSWTKDVNLEKITKRTMLSVAHKVFDPIGFTSPVMICPKMMLQKTWKIGLTWDEEITGDLKNEFIGWFRELNILEEIEIPRYIQVTPDNLKKCTLHTFCDASNQAYAAVVFLRIEKADQVKLFLLAAKSRISPLKCPTIPRMELLAALIGARLSKSVTDAFSWENMERYFWSDSTTVLAWIIREENWSVFVRNRVQEIRSLTDPSLWKYIPSEMNPSDLPSRGCKAKQLVSLKWWEGPSWLKNPYEYNKHMDFICQNINEEDVEREKLKSTKLLINVDENSQNTWYYHYFSCYEKIVRLVGWILRFKHNTCNTKDKVKGELTSQEFHKAEMKIAWMIQKEAFSSKDYEKLKTLETFKDEEDIIRVKTKILYRQDKKDFLTPIVLPSNHEVVKRLISYFHLKNCHAGPQILLNLIREKYWILNGRRTVTSVLSKCTTCKRFNSKNVESSPISLPENRVKDAAVFQVIGIDMAGPLFLKDNQKSWVILFTCAIYRAVHFELVTSASTEVFLMALRRFISRRGRCSIIYCDNGSNFVGAANYLKRLNWNHIQKDGATNSIEWKFNPPTAAWWGGWWERLIRLMKDLLKRVLGRACLNYEEMITVLADCESIINSRPLTYMSEQESIKPISPAMFLKDIHEYIVPDIDAVEGNSFKRRLKYRQALQKSLRNRFRSEYLGLLIQRPNVRRSQQTVSVGDIVLVGADNKKRMHWPLGRIIELIHGKDGKVRLVKLQTSHSEILRPIQRIYPLEVSSSDGAENTFPNPAVKEAQIKKPLEDKSCREIRKTRSGRLIKMPDRLIL